MTHFLKEFLSEGLSADLGAVDQVEACSLLETSSTSCQLVAMTRCLCGPSRRLGVVVQVEESVLHPPIPFTMGGRFSVPTEI